jgi:flagellar hook assembly protein FlgD
MIDVFNVRGVRVRSLVDESQSMGEHQVTWNGADDAGQPASSGLYFVRMTAGSYTETRKIVMLK